MLPPFPECWGSELDEAVPVQNVAGRQDGKVGSRHSWVDSDDYSDIQWPFFTQQTHSSVPKRWWTMGEFVQKTRAHVPGSDRLGTFKRKLRWSPLLPGRASPEQRRSSRSLETMWTTQEWTQVLGSFRSSVEINRLLICSKLQESTHQGKNFGTCQTYSC